MRWLLALTPIAGAFSATGYQVADDIHDLMSKAEDIGKPCGQDSIHGRPSATTELGYAGAVERLQQLMSESVQSIPPCPGAAELRGIIMAASKAFVPKGIAQRAA